MLAGNAKRPTSLQELVISFFNLNLVHSNNYQKCSQPPRRHTHACTHTHTHTHTHTPSQVESYLSPESVILIMRVTGLA